MLETRIKVPFDKVEWIAHTADIHIRNLIRHTEYDHVFNKLYAEIKAFTGNGIIYLGGDIVHAKLEMSPELVDATSRMFKALAEIAPVVLIAGNHDANLNNTNRMDALAPIVNALDHPNLFYFRESGVYHMADVSFAVMSRFEDSKFYIKAREFDSDTKIALYHGSVGEYTTDANAKVFTGTLPITKFQGYDLALLGDIHKTQYFGSKNEIAYPGSLIRQTFGESLTRGFLKWDVAARTSEFIQIENDYSLYKMIIKNGEMPIVKDFPKHGNLTLTYENTNRAQRELVQAKVKEFYNVQNFKISTGTDSLTQQKQTAVNTFKTGDVYDINYLNYLVKEYLEKHFPDSKEMLDEILEINKMCFADIPVLDRPQNVEWKLKSFKFSNMFSYGEDNFIDFTSMKSVIGMFAANASGKSAILDSLAFCLFDKNMHSRVSRAWDIVNNTKEDFSCEVTLEIDNVEYGIKRTGYRAPTVKKPYNCPTKVDFWYISDDDEQISLNGNQRSDTNKNIRGYIGNYDDFVLTTMSPQNAFTVFIDKKQAARLGILTQFLGLDVFEELFTRAVEHHKDIEADMKKMLNRDYDQELATAEIDRKQYLGIKETSNGLKTAKEAELEAIGQDINALYKKRKNIDSSITDIDDLKNKKVLADAKLSSTKEKAPTLLKSLEENAKKLTQISDELTELEAGNTQVEYEELLDYEREATANQSDIDLLTANVENAFEAIADLNIAEYNPECDVCTAREKVSIQRKTELEDQITEYKKPGKLHFEKREHLKKLISFKDGVREDKESLDTLGHDKVAVEALIANITVQKVQVLHAVNDLETEIQNIDDNIKEYYLKEKDILINKKVDADIASKEADQSTLKSEIEALTQKYQHALVMIERSESSVTTLTSELSEFNVIAKKEKAYNLYVNAVRRSGIRYELIEQSIGHIETAVNSVLEHIVDFQILITMPSKTIDLHIVYGDGRVWNIEMASGMEKFIASLAMRVGLIEVCNLPKNNALFLDEGFGNLDAHNMGAVHDAFQFLNEKFTFIVVISHLDTMRDMVDDFLDISKKGDYSFVDNRETT